MILPESVFHSLIRSMNPPTNQPHCPSSQSPQELHRNTFLQSPFPVEGAADTTTGGRDHGHGKCSQKEVDAAAVEKSSPDSSSSVSTISALVREEGSLSVKDTHTLSPSAQPNAWLGIRDRVGLTRRRYSIAIAFFFSLSLSYWQRAGFGGAIGCTRDWT